MASNIFEMKFLVKHYHLNQQNVRPSKQLNNMQGVYIWTVGRKSYEQFENFLKGIT